MKERPILFSSPMVRAILDGRKTQTRRVVKPQPVPHESADPGDVVWFGGKMQKVRESRGRNKRAMGLLNAHDWNPYGKPGDRLWVKENYRLGNQWDDTPAGMVFASPKPDVWYEADGARQNGLDRTHLGRLRPSIHMPRKISRLTLEITGVRVKRLQSISEADAIAEGVDVLSGTDVPGWNKHARYAAPLSRPVLARGDWLPSARYAFEDLWESINGPGSWAANPWAWVIEFRRIEK